MHALWRVHAALRPGGVLLDIHPQPGHALIEVDMPAGRWVAGSVDAAALIAKVIRARAALARLIAAGAFVPEQTETFTFRTTYDSVPEWLEIMTTRWVSMTVPPAVIERVRAWLPTGEGVIALRETCHAARLRRADPTESSRHG